MKIFVLEDANDRIAYFYLLFLNHEIVATNSVREARTILEKTKFDYIFLDHDLGGQVFVDLEDRNCGSYICKHMHETLNTNTPIVVHSWNDCGTKNMISHLKSNGHNGSIEAQMYGTEQFNTIVSNILIENIKQNPPENKSEVKSAYQIASSKRFE